MLSQGFLDWQMTFLPERGMRLTEEPIAGTISDALRKLLPRTVPIVTRYLFWPLNEEWTLYLTMDGLAHRRHLYWPLSFVGYPVEIAFALNACEAEFAKVHAGDEDVVRADHIQQF